MGTAGAYPASLTVANTGTRAATVAVNVMAYAHPNPDAPSGYVPAVLDARPPSAGTVPAGESLRLPVATSDLSQPEGGVVTHVAIPHAVNVGRSSG